MTDYICYILYLYKYFYNGCIECWEYILKLLG